MRLHAAEMQEQLLHQLEAAGDGGEDGGEAEAGPDVDAMTYEELLQLGETVGEARAGASEVRAGTRAARAA